MADFLSILEFSFSVTGPIFVILLLGVWLRRIGLITEPFIDAGSKLVFNVALPALLFISIATTDFDSAANAGLILYGILATCAVFVALELLAARTVHPREDRGVVVQGAFRSNMGIVGLAYCVNAYGEAGLVAASLYLGLVTIVYNILAVVTLNRSLSKKRGIGGMIKGIFTNPLIIGIVLALPVSYFEIRLPSLVLQSGRYFADMTLPLALLCTGASLNFASLRDAMSNTFQAAGLKLVLVPLLITAGGYFVGFRGIELGVLMLMSSAPTAAASYVMVRAMGGNATLAANIIALTTLGSIIATSVGITLLRSAGLM